MTAAMLPSLLNGGLVLLAILVGALATLSAAAKHNPEPCPYCTHIAPTVGALYAHITVHHPKTAAHA